MFGGENWLEVLTLVLVAVLLYTPDSSLTQVPTPQLTSPHLPQLTSFTSSPPLTQDCGTERYLAAIALVLAWATLITLVGRHPKLSR